MNLVKSIGLSAFYRVRRISKAFKNWKKFGVVMFGSLFVASTFISSSPLNPAFAAGGLNSVSIEPSSINLSVGGTRQLNAVARDASGAKIESGVTYTWSVSDPTAANVSQTGMFTALKAGNWPGLITVQAQQGTITKSKVANAVISNSGTTTQSGVLTSAVIVPNNILVTAGTQRQLTGHAYDQYGREMTGVNYVFSMNNAAAGSVTPSGLFTAGATKGIYDQAVKMVATSGTATKTAFAKITVGQEDAGPIIASVVITPPSTVLQKGAQQDFDARSFDQFGREITSGVTYVWSLTNNSVGTINQNGLFTAGNTTGFFKDLVKVTATFKGVSKSDFADVTIQDATVTCTINNVVIVPNNILLEKGQNRPLTAKAYDKFGKELTSGVSYSWSVVNATAGTINQNGVFTAGNTKGIFDKSVKVTATGCGGTVIGFAKVTISESDPGIVLTEVRINPTSIDICEAATQQFTVKAFDQFGKEITTGVSYTWNVTNNLSGNISNSGLFTAGTRPGFYDNAVSVTGTLGAATKTAFADVQVNNCAQNVCVTFETNPRTALNLPLVNGTAQKDFTLIARDQNGDDVTLTNVTWALTGIGNFNQTSQTSGRFTATSAGNATLTVTSTECGTYTTPISVVAPEGRILLRVEVTPEHVGPIVCPSTVSFTARGYDQEDKFIDPTVEPITFTWELNNSAIGTLHNNTGPTVTFTCKKGFTGTFSNFLTATGHYKNLSDDDSASITLEDLVIQDNLKCPVTVNFSRNPINTNDSTVITASAFTTAGAPITGATFNWQVMNGNGTLSSATGNPVTFFSGSMVGSAVVRLTTSYAGSQCVQDVVINITNNAGLRVEITPDPAYAQPNTDVTFTARAWDEFNNEVTGSTTFTWSMLNFSAGTIISTFGNQAVVRTSSNFGTFTNAIQVTGTRNNLSDSDEATIIIQQANNFKIDASLVGFAANNNNGVCTDDMITYRLTVTNNQPNTLNGVKAALQLPANTQFISATSVTGSPYLAGRQVEWIIGTLAYGQSRVMEVRVIPTGNLKGSHNFVATAQVSSYETSASVSSNAVNLNCGGTPVVPGKGPLASTGLDWRVLGLIALAALVFSSGTYAVLRRREQRF